jgi:hypothetical protein
MPTLKFNDAILMCKSDMIDVNDNVQIGDEEANEDCEKVNNILHTFKYKPTVLDKKTFMAWGKQYLKKVMAHLKNGTEADQARAPEFQKGATEFIKFLVGKFKDFEFFTPDDFDMENGLIFSFWEDEENDVAPTFCYFADGLKACKF